MKGKCLCVVVKVISNCTRVQWILVSKNSNKRIKVVCKVVFKLEICLVIYQLSRNLDTLILLLGLKLPLYVIQVFRLVRRCISCVKVVQKSWFKVRHIVAQNVRIDLLYIRGMIWLPTRQNLSNLLYNSKMWKRKVLNWVNGGQKLTIVSMKWSI